MTDATFVFAGYVVVFGGVAAYAAVVIARGKRLSREVPAERRRWMDAP